MAERNTVQKAMVYEALCKMADHPTADRVHREVQKTYPNISRATVYRILNRMAEKGEILKVSTTTGADHFDHTTYPHYHVRCTNCGKVCDVSMPYMHELEKSISDASGFQISGYVVQFEGLCPECSKGGQ